MWTWCRPSQGAGCWGEHRATLQHESEVATRREITLIQQDHLPLIGAWSGLSHVDARHRRRGAHRSDWALRAVLTHGDAARARGNSECLPFGDESKATEFRFVSIAVWGQLQKLNNSCYCV